MTMTSKHECKVVVFSSNVEFENSIVKIPQKLLLTNYIITDIFSNTFRPNAEEIRDKVILLPKNNYVLALNNDILSRLEGQTNVYLTRGAPGRRVLDFPVLGRKHFLLLNNETRVSGFF